MRLLRFTAILLLCAGLCYLQCFAEIVDGFEGSAHFAGWVIEKSNARVDISEERAHSGKKSLKFTALPGAEQSCTLEKSFDMRDSGTVSVWFYDSMAEKSPGAYLYIACGDKAPLYIGTQDNDPQKYHAGIDIGGSSVGRTQFKRSKGWHQLAIEVSRRGVICLIDSKIAFASGVSFQFDSAGLEMVGAKAKLSSSYYFDDFVIRSGADVLQAKKPSHTASSAVKQPVAPMFTAVKANSPVALSASSTVQIRSQSTKDLSDTTSVYRAKSADPAAKSAATHNPIIPAPASWMLFCVALGLIFVLSALIWTRKLLVGTFGIIKRRREENPCYGVADEDHLEKLTKLIKARSSWEISENFIHGSTVILSVNTRVLVVKKLGPMRNVRILKGKREGKAFWVHKKYIKPIK